MSNSNSNNNANKNKRNNQSQKKPKKRSAAALERRRAKWQTQKAAKKAESVAEQAAKKAESVAEQAAKKAEEERKTKSVLAMFPDIMGIVGSNGFMPNIKASTRLSKNISASLQQVPAFQDADRSTIYPNGMTILNKYLMERNWAEANRILDLGVSKKVLEHPLTIGGAPLMYLLDFDQYDLFVKILDKGADPNLKIDRGDKYFYNILHYVVAHSIDEKRKLLYIDALVKKKANLNILDSGGYSPVEVAIRSRYPNIAKHLIDLNVHVEEPNKNGFTPVITAINSGDMEILAYIIEKRKINLNKQTGLNKLSPLKAATLNAKKELLEFLLTYSDDLDLNQKDNEGNTALHYAVLTRNYDKIIMLKRAGANPRLSNEKRQTALELASLLFGRDNEHNPKAREAYALLKEQ